jgi:CheY-like chemotaxis protein
MLEEHSYLYVEDDPLSREIMSTIMGKVMGIRSLTIFEDSVDFTTRLKALPVKPTIILLDIQMQPHDGFALLQMLRSDPDYRHLKIIALTASVMNEEVDRLRTCGFDGAIAKPLSVKTFPSLISRIVKGEPVWHIA